MRLYGGEITLDLDSGAGRKSCLEREAATDAPLIRGIYTGLELHGTDRGSGETFLLTMQNSVAVTFRIDLGALRELAARAVRARGRKAKRGGVTCFARETARMKRVDPVSQITGPEPAKE